MNRKQNSKVLNLNLRVQNYYLASHFLSEYIILFYSIKSIYHKVHLIFIIIKV